MVYDHDQRSFSFCLKKVGNCVFIFVSRKVNWGDEGSPTLTKCPISPLRKTVRVMGHWAKKDQPSIPTTTVCSDFSRR